MTAEQSQQRESEIQEIVRLAHELGYIDGDDRTVYEALLGTYFHDAQTARALTDKERGEWLGMLKLWRQGANISTTQQAAINQALASRPEERRTA